LEDVTKFIFLWKTMRTVFLTLRVAVLSSNVLLIRAHTSAKTNPVANQSPDNFYKDPFSFSRDMSQITRMKNALSRNVEDYFLISRSGFIGGWLSNT